MTDTKPSALSVEVDLTLGQPENSINQPPPPYSAHGTTPPYPGLTSNLPGFTPLPPLPPGFTPSTYSPSYPTSPPSYQPVPLYPSPLPHQTITQFVVHPTSGAPPTVQPLPKNFNRKKYFLVVALLFGLVFTFFEFVNARMIVTMHMLDSRKEYRERATIAYQTSLVINIFYSFLMLYGIIKHRLCLATTYAGLQILFALGLVYAYFVMSGGAGLAYTIYSVILASVAFLFVKDLRIISDGKRLRGRNRSGIGRV